MRGEYCLLREIKNCRFRRYPQGAFRSEKLTGKLQFFLEWKRRLICFKSFRFFFADKVSFRRGIFSGNSVKVSRYQFPAQEERRVVVLPQAVIADAEVLCIRETAFPVEKYVSFKAEGAAPGCSCFFTTFL